MDSYYFLIFLLNIQLPNEIRCSQSKLKSSEINNEVSINDFLYV